MDGSSSRWVLPKEPLIDFALEPKEVQRLTADQANSLIVAALTPLAQQVHAPLADILRLLRVIVRNERPGGTTGTHEYRQLADWLGTRPGDLPARQLLERARELDSSYVLLCVLTTNAGTPMRRPGSTETYLFGIPAHHERGRCVVLSSVECFVLGWGNVPEG